MRGSLRERNLANMCRMTQKKLFWQGNVYSVAFQRLFADSYFQDHTRSAQGAK